MESQVETQAFVFDRNANRLVFKSDCRLFSTNDINVAIDIREYLVRNHVSIMYIDISAVCFWDSSCELFVYRVAQYFAKDYQRSLIVLSNDDAMAQNRVVRTLLQINPETNIEFILD